MEQRKLNELLAAVAAGEVSPEQAAAQLRTEPFSDLGFAKVDHHRGIRQGAAEVIFGQGKTPDQIAAIIASMLDAGEEHVLITRIEPEAAEEVARLLSDGLTFSPSDQSGPSFAQPAPPSAQPASPSCQPAPPSAQPASPSCHPERSEGSSRSDAPDVPDVPDAPDALDVPDMPVFTYYDLPRLATVGVAPKPDGAGTIVVACGGTSDIYVAEEAAITAEMLGNEVVRLYDVGVAGLHRLLAHADELARARVVVAVAGMEGALPSVVGGLVSCPVIAVPTSVGYGAAFDGVAALLAMLNSCASGVSVVNIDNGFGAGYQASLINHVERNRDKG